MCLTEKGIYDMKSIQPWGVAVAQEVEQVIYIYLVV